MALTDRAQLPLADAEGVKQGLLATGSVTGSVLTSFLAASCCVVPMSLAALGASSTLAPGLNALSPYYPFFLAATIAFLAAGCWSVYRTPKVPAACVDGSYCARPVSGRVARIALWAATALTVYSLGVEVHAALFMREPM